MHLNLYMQGIPIIDCRVYGAYGLATESTRHLWMWLLQNDMKDGNIIVLGPMQDVVFLYRPSLVIVHLEDG